MVGYKRRKTLHYPLEDNGTYCYCDLPQDVLRDGFAFFNNLLIKLIQRRVHQLHTDPNIPLKKDTR